MTKHEQATTIRELSDAEIDVVSGGTKPTVVDVAHDAAKAAERVNNVWGGKVGGGTLNI